MEKIILTKNEINKILVAGEGETEVSLDMGITYENVLVEDGIVTIRDQKIPISELKSAKENFCYVAEENSIHKIAFFSDETNLYYKLAPTSDWPTFELSSTPMHRSTKVSPKENTELVMKEISPVQGKVLDTCCGSGYTATMASEHADEVETYERDSNVLELAKYNPYSQQLFTNKKITVHNEDIFEAIKNLPSECFDRVIHDPPTFTVSPQLYSKEFYMELYRVMKKGALLYHYAPWPGKTKGDIFYTRIIRDLSASGFKIVEYHEVSCGVRAVKQ